MPDSDTGLLIRLRRNRPVNLSAGRIILTGLLYPTIDNLYEGAQLITIAPGALTPTINALKTGDVFHLEGRWILHTVLDLGDGEAAANILRRRRRTIKPEKKDPRLIRQL